MADIIRHFFKLKIRHLFYLALVIASIAAITVFSISFFNFYKNNIKRKTVASLKLKLSLAAELIEKNLNEGSSSEVEAVIAYLSTMDNVELVVVTDKNGNILFSSIRKLINKNIKNVLKDVPIDSFLEGNFRYIFTRNDKKLYIKDTIFINKSTEIRPIEQGYLILKYDFSKDIHAVYSALIVADILFLLSVLIAGFILDITFKKYISKRISTLTSVLNEVSKGNLDVKASIEGNDEIKEIAEYINVMIEKLKEYVYYDYITGVYNRFFFEKKVNEKIKNNQEFVLFIFDTDNFKEINDLFGHDIGDKILQQYAFRLQNLVKDYGFVGRFGGDEFLVCFEKCCFNNESEIRLFATKLLNELSKPFIVEDFKINITSTAGISLYPQHAKNYRDLLKVADIAMYYGKKIGKNVAVVANEEIVRENIRKAEISNYIKTALEKNEFFLVYQPIFDAKNLKMVGVEALLRWKSDKFGFVSPAEFIPVLEETGLIKEVGKWIFKQVLKQANLWEEEGIKNIKINVNVDIQQFLEVDFTKFLKREILDKNFNHVRLGIEITESEAMQYPELIKSKIQEIRGNDIIVSIDDFGTGNSSLSYLKLMNVDYIKIDKSFIDGVPEEKDSKTLVKAIVDLAKSFNYKTVAEGVETKSQLEFLKSIGCDELQGYYLSKPVPPEEIVKIYKKGELFP